MIQQCFPQLLQRKILIQDHQLNVLEATLSDRIQNRKLKQKPERQWH